MQSESVSEEFFVEAVKRASLFDVLSDGPREMDDLVENLDMSRSTVHRATRSFVQKGLLRECADGFELTGLGRAVGEEVLGLRTRVEAATKLRPFLNTVEPTSMDIPPELFADATVVHPKPRQPHFAVKRIIELIEASESVRMFSSIISPFYVDVAYRAMLDGTKIEVVFDHKIMEIIADEYIDKAAQAAQTGNFGVFVYENVPFELFVFDDAVGMAAHDDSGIARVFVEADSPTAIEWAEDVYETYRERANQIDVTTF